MNNVHFTVHRAMRSVKTGKFYLQNLPFSGAEAVEEMKLINPSPIQVKTGKCNQQSVVNYTLYTFVQFPLTNFLFPFDHSNFFK